MNTLRVRRGRAISIAAVTLALLAAPLGVAPAVAAQPSPVAKYVALGDSYAAGQGSADQVIACGTPGVTGYPVLLGQVSRTNLLRDPSCSGATVADVQSNQLGAVNRGTTLVTITAGGNDLDIAAVYAACSVPGDQAGCALAFGMAQQRMAAVGPAMAGLVAATRMLAPNAVVIVTGYPVPFSATAVAADPRAGIVNQGVATLDQLLSGAATASGAVFADVDPSFAGHRIGDVDPATWTDQSWLGSDLSDPVTFLHPTAAGDAAYAAAIQAVR
ncbi:SGNH/GDSL hydrolase family protein [Microbacterium panaciterrae]|uniref:SGNH family lipase n=1 Tax=Microbacterium panaciterrae TaxID=985759 RepID=A0ABP8PJ81_9MICO